MVPTSLDHATVDSFLRGLRYPLWRGDLMRLAATNQVPDDLTAALLDLPDREYQSHEDVMGKLREQGHRLT
jgi:uncharacterized protein DUF2795